MKNVIIRKTIAKLKRKLSLAGAAERPEIINKIYYLKDSLNDNVSAPTFGKLRRIIEKDVEEERSETLNKVSPSENDVKRLALKESVLEYYNGLAYDPESIVVEYMGSSNLRRDNKKVDPSNLDFAPNKNEIYQIWMDKLRTLARHKKLNPAELDEAAERGTPQGGAFEKILDRYRKDFMKKLWER